MAGRSIGETVGEFEARRGEMSDTIWIKGFKVGDTKVRPWPMPTDDWVRYREHYDPDARRFVPCLGDASECIMCSSPIERLAKTSAKVVMPAVDDEGRLQYYKIPGSVLDTMQRREQRNGTVSDRDFIIWRTGSSMTDTRYGADDGEKFKFKFKDVDGEPLSKAEIKQELGAKYDEYVDEFGAVVTKSKRRGRSADDEDEPRAKSKSKSKGRSRDDDDDDDFEPPRREARRSSRNRDDDDDEPPRRSAKRASSRDDDDDEPPRRPAKKAASRVADDDDEPPARPTKKAAARAPRAASNGDIDPDAEADDPVDSLGKDPSDEEIEAAPTNVIKRWLAGNGVVLEGRQTRAALIKQAQEFIPF